MKKTVLLFTMLCLSIFICATSSFASLVGWIDTERFGYTGTITRYSDADLDEQVGEILQLGDRDLCIWSNSASPASMVMGSWWYSTATNPTTGLPSGAGSGNTHGNTGPGFMQYYDSGQDYVTKQSYSFSDFDGSFWTTFSFELDVLNAPYTSDTSTNAYSRLSAPSNTEDSGIFHSLSLNLTATGLKGELQSNGWIVAEESKGYPTGVTGKLTGVFQNTALIKNTSTPSNSNGYYVFDLDINMTNWAYENKDKLVGVYSPFYEGSYGAPVPEPTTMLLFGFGLLGLAGASRRKRA